MKSISCHFGALAVAPMNRGLSNHLKPPSSPRGRASRDRGHQRDHGADQEHERESLDLGDRDREEASAVIAVTTFASMIVWKHFA